MKLEFEKEGETKNTMKYAEKVKEGQRGVIGRLYILKSDASGLGDNIVVTIEAKK